jgi:hypothetical protein
MRLTSEANRPDSLPKAARKNYDFCQVSVEIDNDQVRETYLGRAVENRPR